MINTIIATILLFIGVVTRLSTHMTEYKCPYCDRKSASPGGVRFHVKLTHPDRLDEFNEKYYPEMESTFKASFQE